MLGHRAPKEKEEVPMPRVTPITTKEQVASEHRPIFDAVAEGRGSVRGPFSIMMFSPEMCSRVLNTSNFLRLHRRLEAEEVTGVEHAAAHLGAEHHDAERAPHAAACSTPVTSSASSRR